MAEPDADAGIFMGLKYSQDLPLICWICLGKSLLSCLEELYLEPGAKPKKDPWQENRAMG